MQSATPPGFFFMSQQLRLTSCMSIGVVLIIASGIRWIPYPWIACDFCELGIYQTMYLRFVKQVDVVSQALSNRKSLRRSLVFIEVSYSMHHVFSFLATKDSSRIVLSNLSVKLKMALLCKLMTAPWTDVTARWIAGILRSYPPKEKPIVVLIPQLVHFWPHDVRSGCQLKPDPKLSFQTLIIYRLLRNSV